MVDWCSVSYFMWSGALDLQLSFFSIIICIITVITNNQYTNICLSLSNINIK